MWYHDPMSEIVKIAERAMEQAERFEQTSRRGGILSGPILLLALGAAVPVALGAFECAPWVVGVSLTLPLGVLLATFSIVRAAIQNKQLMLFAPENVIIQAMRTGLLGTREHQLESGSSPVPKVLDASLRQELAAIPIDAHTHNAQLTHVGNQH